MDSLVITISRVVLKENKAEEEKVQSDIAAKKKKSM